MLNNYDRKMITPNIPFGRLVKFDEALGIVDVFTIYYADIRAGTNFTSISSVAETVGFGELELNFENSNKFKQVVDLIDISPLAIEVYIHDDYSNLDINQFNKWYFIDYDFYEKNTAKNKLDMKIKAIDFAGAIEDKTICEHNIEYTSISTDADGNPIEPPNFNLIVYENTTSYFIYSDLFRFNIVLPINRNKGGTHITELSRKPKGIGDLMTNLNLGEFFAYTSEKKSLFTIRRELNQILKNQQDIQNLPNLELKLEDGVFNVYLKINDEIMIDNFINQDRVITQSREKNNRNSIEDALVESDKVDLVSVHKVRERPNMWKQKEALESASPNEGTEEVENPPTSPLYREPLASKTDEVLGNGTPVDKAELEMNIKNAKYFDTLDAHTIIEVKNFGEFYDGQYRVDKISCVVEQTYLSFSLENITKINI